MNNNIALVSSVDLTLPLHDLLSTKPYTEYNADSLIVERENDGDQLF